MYALLLSLPIAADRPVAAFKLSSSAIRLPCITGACQPPVRREDYRVPYEPDPRARTSKQRAFAEDGTRCGQIGDKYCTSNGHTVLRMDFGE